MNTRYLCSAGLTSKTEEEQVFRTRGYLLKITKNRACTVRKRKKRELPQENILEFMPSELKTPELRAIDEERKESPVSGRPFFLINGQFHKLFTKQERFWNATVSLAERQNSIIDSDR